MKRFITAILILSLCMSLMMPAFTQADNGAYYFSAADSLKTGNFSTYNYNGTKVVSFSKSKTYYEGDVAQPTEPTLQFSFYAEKSKEYHVWIKGLVISASADSIWAKFDTESEYTKAILPVDESGFKWCKVYMGYLEAGEHTIDPSLILGSRIETGHTISPELSPPVAGLTLLRAGKHWLELGYCKICQLSVIRVLTSISQCLPFHYYTKQELPVITF